MKPSYFSLSRLNLTPDTVVNLSYRQLQLLIKGTVLYWCNYAPYPSKTLKVECKLNAKKQVLCAELLRIQSRIIWLVEPCYANSK